MKIGVLLLSLLVSAQVDAAGSGSSRGNYGRNSSAVNLMPIVGVTSSTIVGAKNSDGSDGSASNRSGMQFGMEALFGGDTFQFETGLISAERGFIRRESYNFGSLGTGSFTRNVKLKYLEVPLLLRVNFAKTDSSQFYVNMGVVVADMQGYENKVESADGVFKGMETTTSGSANDFGLNKTDTRAALGIGAMIHLGSNASWTLGIDYQNSLNKINKDGSDNVRNVSFGASTGLLVAL